MLPCSGMGETPGEGLVSLLFLKTSVQDKNKLKGFSDPKQKASWAHCTWAHCTWDMLLYRNDSTSPFFYFFYFLKCPASSMIFLDL